MSTRPCLIVLTPSLRIAGGNKEVVRLAAEAVADGRSDAVIVSMWKHPHEVDTGSLRVVHLLDAPPIAGRALIQLPVLVRAFRTLLARLRRTSSGPLRLMLTHYSSYLLGWVAPSVPRVCFNQDLEWLFVAEGWRRRLLKQAILLTNRRSAVVTTNAYVTDRYREESIEPFGEASIWAEPRWSSADLPPTRDIDVLMLVRASAVKRLDLYLEALRLFRERTALRIAVVTPDSALADQLQQWAAQVYLRPSDGELQALYGRARIFLLLSDVEGFGLPPLEAMGSGCIPACRDSGGVRCYMHGAFAEMLFPQSMPIEEIIATVDQRLREERLPSAEAARAAFAEGLRASRQSRQECVHRLQVLLSNDAR